MTALHVAARVHAYPPGHNAGAEWMLHTMLRHLVANGHRATVWLSRWSGSPEPYELDGVQVMPQGASNRFVQDAGGSDVVVSHLECVPAAGALARGFGRPFVVLCHNTFGPTFRDVAAGDTALAVYNSQWMSRTAGVFFAEFPDALTPRSTVVVRPPVVAEDYATRPGECFTLVNCNPEKGAKLLGQLAARMPDSKFLAVLGAYGEQAPPDLPNVEVVGHVSGREMRDKVYGRTRVLLMPSVYESWGRAGVEAMASGIPVLAHPTPGLTESLGEAGIFADRNDPDAWVAALGQLGSGQEWGLASKRARARSQELDPTPDLNAWLAAVESLRR